MIEELAVSNLGVLREARIEPGPGLVVVTGETGAGKTLLLGSLRLLVGGASADVIGPAGGETRVEARIVDEDGTEIVGARRVVAGRRSRSYLDGRMVPLRVLGERFGPLLEIVGQTDRLALTRPGELRRLLDGFGGAADVDASGPYAAAWQRLRDVEDALTTLGGDRRALERELDLCNFQANEITAAGFTADDDEALPVRAARLRNAGDLMETLGAALEEMRGDDGAETLVAQAAERLDRAARLDPSIGALAERVRLAVETLAELGGDIREALGSLEHDPAELETLERRLALAGDLRRKYGATLAEVVEFAATAEQRGAEIAGLLERAGTLDAERDAARFEVASAGDALRRTRKAAAQGVEAASRRELLDLGFTDPHLEFRIDPAEPTGSGADRVDLVFASASGLVPGPVSRVASGGELSRLVLALRLAAGSGEAPVVVFDEIDAGIGGATALVIGRKLADLAGSRQVLCVTHLPQVAAFADAHFVVERDGAVASVRRIADDERREELARMLSGLPESERGRDHADELLELAGSRGGR